MTHADASKQRGHTKKRTWRDGASDASGAACGRARPPVGCADGAAAASGGVASAASALLAKYRAFSSTSAIAADNLPPPPPSLVDVLPSEMVAQVLAFADGPSLLRCSETCRTMARLSHARDVWRNICMTTWPSLRTQILPQLPGAPDYDLIRLYGGSWRRCFVERHRLDQRAEMRVAIPQFANAAANGVDKVVSETFAIGEHRFCLWIFPNGNPNEPQYVGRVLSVYLVLTDLEDRAPDWLTCAVFSLAVVNHKDPSRKIEWHSCLVDNKFDSTLHNWGIHSLGSLKTLRNPASGYLQNEALTVTANVRLMSITFRVVFEHDLARHRKLGLADFEAAATLELPFCCSLQDLLKKLAERFGVDPATVRVWCFNQPVVSGQALRPRKRLTQQAKPASETLPLFGNLLCDGVDIDAYSFCLLYVESPDHDESVLNAMELETMATDMDDHDDVDMESESHSTVSLSPTSSSTSASSAFNASSSSSSSSSSSYLFVKVLDPETLEFLYLGRFAFHATSASFSTASIYECAARRLHCSSYDLCMFKEEIAPTLYSGPIAWSTDSAGKGGFAVSLQAADIVVFTHRATVASGVFDRAMRGMLHRQYAAAERMLKRDHTAPTLAQIETLAERLDIPKFRVRSAFRKCHEHGRNTLRYIMEGRHLGFICDSCGETDFKGARFNCTVCSDYDLCRQCHEKSLEVSHRYANVDGKWQRVYEFKDHKTSHATREMLPVFYDYTPRPRRGSSSAAARAW